MSFRLCLNFFILSVLQNGAMRLKGTGDKEEYLERVEINITYCFNPRPVEKKGEEDRMQRLGLILMILGQIGCCGMSCDRLGVRDWILERRMD